jgi:hypothetical protein
MNTRGKNRIYIYKKKIGKRLEVKKYKCKSSLFDIVQEYEYK